MKNFRLRKENKVEQENNCELILVSAQRGLNFS